MIDEILAEIKAALAELECAGIIERTGEMEWSERHHEWQPVTFTRNLDEHSPRPGSVSTSTKHDCHGKHYNIVLRSRVVKAAGLNSCNGLSKPSQHDKP